MYACIVSLCVLKHQNTQQNSQSSTLVASQENAEEALGSYTLEFIDVFFYFLF